MIESFDYQEDLQERNNYDFNFCVSVRRLEQYHLKIAVATGVQS